VTGKVDVHTHVLPGDLPDLDARYGRAGFARLEHLGPGCARMTVAGKHFRDVDERTWDPARRLRDCDAAGVDIQVLSTVPVMFSYWAAPADAHDLARLLNDHLAGLVRDHPRRFVGLGTLPLQDPDRACRELERVMRDLGLAGVEIGTHVNEWNLDEPELFPVFERCQELGAAVFVHPWDMMGRERMPRYMLPWLVGMPAETALAASSLVLGGVLDRLPRLRVCLAHGGGAFAWTLGRIEHAWRTRPDLCNVAGVGPPTGYAARFYYDSALHDAAALRFLLDRVGADRITLGSDYPFPLGEERPGALIEALGERSATERQRLLRGTALEFLGRPGPAS
jgi:aminocarboxymuconate-semialdehyde decarboxylase